jgi:hypothetical protein
LLLNCLYRCGLQRLSMMSLARPLCTGNASNSSGPRMQQAKRSQYRDPPALFFFFIAGSLLAWTKFSVDLSVIVFFHSRL